MESRTGGITKEPRTSKALKASFTSVKISVYDSTIGKRRHGIQGGVKGQKALTSKRTNESSFTFTKNTSRRPEMIA